MRVVVALGGNALLKRGEPMTAENQRQQRAARPRPRWPPSPTEHELVLSHGNGPQVGLLALQAAAYTEVEPYPLDVLGAQTEGMIGYVLEQELGNAMPRRRAARDDPDDGRGRPGRPGVRRPDQVRRAGLHQGPRPTRWPPTKGWAFKPDGDSWRRVVPSPEPRRIFEIRPIRWLLDHGVVRDLRRRRRRADDVPARRARRPWSASRRSSTRTSPASCWPARSTADLFVHGHRRRRGVRRLGHARSSGRWDG